MTSKEIIQDKINEFKAMLKYAEEIKRDVMKKCSQYEIEQYNQVLKDLEDYEELKKIMGTPIQDIMKRLKILEILKNKQVNIHFDLVVKDTYEEYLAGVEGSKVILAEKEWNKLKEWLKDEE